MKAQHFIGISGGADSLATACLARERLDRGGFADNRPPVWFACDVDHESPITVDYWGEVTQALGIELRILKADFTHLFAARREAIRAAWAVERRRMEHTPACKRRRATGVDGEDWRDHCRCPLVIDPPLPQEIIDRACDILQPSGNVFLDMCLLHGRFPSVRARFCTDELKVQPIEAMLRPYLDEGVDCISWVGERAEESAARAAKPVFHRIRMPNGSSKIIYRPIHRWTKAECFAIAKRHGIRPNPLYLMGMGRVGCLPCIMAKKKELRQIAARFPEAFAKLAEWERLVAMVARRSAGIVDGYATFFSADKTPGQGSGRSHALAVKDWALRTRRDGRNYDLLIDLENEEVDRSGGRCESEYGLCE